MRMDKMRITGTKATVESVAAWAMVGYVLPIVTTTVVWCERLGYPYTRTDLSGGKWRGEYGQLASFVCVWGIWVYPFTFLATLYFLNVFAKEQSRYRKWVALIAASAMAFCFALFWKLGISPLTGD
jgi:hypothetical protein